MEPSEVLKGLDVLNTIRRTMESYRAGKHIPTKDLDVTITTLDALCPVLMVAGDKYTLTYADLYRICQDMKASREARGK